MPNERPYEYRIIDDLLVTGHVDRKGDFVDIRPVSFNIRWGPSHKNSPINVNVKTGRSKFSTNYTGRIISDYAVLVKIGGLEVWVPYDSSHVLTEEVYNEIHKERIDQENARRERQKEFDTGYSSIDLIASQWLLEAPKQARRFSSGVDSISDKLLIEKIFGKSFVPTEKEIGFVKKKMKICLNRRLNGVKDVW